jgi:3-oxoacyl-[acyl-carrier protein] reductase
LAGEDLIIIAENMDLLLENKKILVTGGSKGIGLACAKVLAMEGADLIISSRSEKNLGIAAKQITARGELHIFPADLSDPREIDDLRRFTQEQFGYLDGLLLNTGGPPLGSSLDHSDQSWLEAVNNLLLSVVRLTRHFVPAMQERNFGRVVCIASTGVKQPIPGLVLSNSVRSAVIAFLKTLSGEVAINNVFINCLLPGSTSTDRLAALHDALAEKQGKPVEEIIAMRKKSVPAGKFGEPEHLAAMAAFLLSGRNGYITGQSISIDGGMVTFPL